MTKDEISLLLYLETRAVDHSGGVATRHMNRGDLEIAWAWDSSGFVKFGRILAADLSGRSDTHWCRLSDDAWKLVHEERRARGLRGWAARKYMTTAEARGEKIE